MTLADSHIHLFPAGFRHDGLPALFGAGEVAAYEAIRAIHGIDLALVIGYEADGIDPDNNATIRRLGVSRGWIRTLAYVDPRSVADPLAIRALLDRGHRGLALYVTDGARAKALLQWPEAAWNELRSRRAIISFNARPETIGLLRPLIAAAPEISFLFSHLGLPGKFAGDTGRAAVLERLAPLLSLAALSNVHVKISGLYAMSEPEFAYPHGAAHHAIRGIIAAFGAARCLWGSDFAPALEFVSFPQTIHWPGIDALSEPERQAIHRGNLVRLLSERP